MNKNEKKNERWGTGKKSCFRPQVQLKNFQFTGGIEKEKVKEEWMKERNLSWGEVVPETMQIWEM